jgi:hypothetical protein
MLPGLPVEQTPSSRRKVRNNTLGEHITLYSHGAGMYTFDMSFAYTRPGCYDDRTGL